MSNGLFEAKANPTVEAVKCSTCYGNLYPIFEQKADGGIKFPPNLLRFDHGAGVKCIGVRRQRERRAILGVS
jgi:hypothetical protein